MKRRFLYALMFSVPAFIFAVILTVFIVAAIAGVLWIFVFGDNAWPSFVDRSMSILIFIVWATAWLLLVLAAYVWGKRQEQFAALNKKHVFLAGGSTVGLLLLALLHQLSVGNIGLRPDSIVCSDFCTTKNFSAIRLPQDGTCRCYSSDGREALIFSIKSLRAQSK